MKFSLFALNLILAIEGGTKNVSAFTALPLQRKNNLSRNHYESVVGMRMSLRSNHPPPPPPPPTPEVANFDLSSVFGGIMDDLKGQLQSVNSFFNDNDFLLSIKERLSLLDDSITDSVTVLTTQTLKDLIHTNFPTIEPYYNNLITQLSNSLSSNVIFSNISPSAILVLSSFVVYTTLSSIFGGDSEEDKKFGEVLEPYPEMKYNPDTARIYFRRRLPVMIKRGIEVLASSLAFAFGVLVQDKYLSGNKDVSNSDEDLNGEDFMKGTEDDIRRGKELADLLTKLGPTYIKVGQSLSIRTDLLSPGYAKGLSTLQDNVPPFDSDIAYEMLSLEWGGKPIKEVLAKISPEPIAAASLGQVYKATLNEKYYVTNEETGETIKEVAIKVQRPNIREQIALDMHLLREIAPIVKTIGNLNSDAAGTVDTWGVGFVDELDYIAEAKNAKYFTDQISKTPLKDVVFAPSIVDSLSTDKVLVTEWIDGERLDKSSSEDVTLLCSVAMNTYLTMLLEIGLLHCDPHPGNLLRTKKDGKLCILDWGMVTNISENLQLTLIEHVAHLTSADYEEIPRDLLLLDFIPQSKANLIKDSNVVELLADIYGAWTKGGGAASVNVNEVISQLQDLTAKKGNLFQIPPYFAYIAKSFSVLEGIGLSTDKKYSIINECLPYISQRLLTDEKNMGPALSTFIFGPDKNNIESRIIDYDRVEQLVTGFGDYTTSASSSALSLLQKSAAADAVAEEESPTAKIETRKQLLQDSADQILDLVFAEEETPFQTILIEQLAKIVASSSRSFFTDLRERSGKLPSGRTVLGTLVDPLGVWRTSPFVRMNELDEKTVETTKKIISLIRNNQKDSSDDVDNDGESSSATATLLNEYSREEIVELSTIIVNKVWERRNAIQKTGNRFMIQLFTLVANKLEKGERDTRKVPVPEPTVEEIDLLKEDNNNNMAELSRSTVSRTFPIRKKSQSSSPSPSVPNVATTKSDAITGASPQAVEVEEEPILVVAVADTDNVAVVQEPSPSSTKTIPDTRSNTSSRSRSSDRLESARRILNEVNQE